MGLDVGNILDAPQRARLLALQKTARQLDVASARLATGQKVSSALDNPGSFFIARSLRNRAGDLEKLLNGIGQNIRAIQTADHGLKAQLGVLDLAESYLQDIENKFESGAVGTQPGVPDNETYVTFAGSGDLVPYVAGQDVPLSGTITVSGGNEVTFDGNYWRRKAFNYSVTPDTVLVFEYRSTVMPEASTIGFDNDMNFGNDSNRFWLYGTQTSGITYAAPTPTYSYNGSGDWETIEIPVGAHFTGNFSHLTFIADDDSAALPLGVTSFRNITLREGPKQAGATVANGAVFEAGYKKIMEQFDALATDAHYRGINLLKGDTMTTYFNKERSSRLSTEGMVSTLEGLGLTMTDFNSIGAVRAKLAEVRAARETLRNYASTLAADLNILRVRDDFTRGQINVSKAGAADLTDADLNEEGATMLALQTAQQLGISMMAMRPANVLSILS